ncbi:hypothetical protein BD779DRAFT_1783639 [Infundibulicybe gibba]|nr:hypothetical protein BD779DRAFT_1783639 [Infundibulicybe gibba]
MRIPTAWDDRRLLEDEPFLTYFQVRVEMSQSMRAGRGSDSHHPVNIRISEGLKSMSGGNDVVQKWIELAFCRTYKSDPRNPPRPGDETILVFIEFYWKLFQKEDSAYAYLRQERKKQGYAYMPDHNSNVELVEPTSDLPCLPTRREAGRHKSRRSKSSVQKRQESRIEVEGRTSSGVSYLRVPKKTDTPGHGEPSIHPVPLSNPALGASSATPSQLTAPKTEPSDNMEGSDNSGVALFPGSPRTANLARSIFSSPMSAENNELLIGMQSRSQLLCAVGENVSIPDTWSSPIPCQSGIPDSASTVKVSLPMIPPIWATSRQEVCESFDWFRAYQSGVYHVHGSVKGYLLSAFSSLYVKSPFVRWWSYICSDETGLSTAEGLSSPMGSPFYLTQSALSLYLDRGGRAESLHSCKGRISTQLADDQLAQDKSVRALISNYHQNRPIALLIDDKYALFPYDLGYKGIAYAVLGFYTIRYAWAEFEPSNNDRGRVIRYKFVFQWCAGQGEPWWIPRDSNEGDLGDSASVVSTKTRKHRRSQPARCLAAGSSDPQYSDNYVYTRCPHCGENIPQVYQLGWACLNPACIRFWLQTDGEPLPLQLDYNTEFLRLLPPMSLPPGFAELCPSSPPTTSEAGATTDYIFSRGWHCNKCGRLSCRYKWEHWECASCGCVVKVTGRLRCAKEFWSQRIPVSFHDHYIYPDSKIIRMPMRIFAHDNGMGQIQSFLLPADRGIIHHIQPGNPVARLSADEIFCEYQEQAATGELAFRRWPLRSHKLRGPLLTNYFSQNSGEPYQYVGGTANTVPFSQAGGAVVKARQLIEDRILQALDQKVHFNEVLSAAYMERQKMAFHSDNEKGLGPIVAGLSLGAPAIMHFRLHSKYEVDKERRNNALTFVLRHGDVLVMEGAKIQECYEHTVAPTNFRIAATARYIEPSRE